MIATHFGPLPHPTSVGLVLTEIRFLAADDWCVLADGTIARKVGRRLPWDDNSRLGIKHLVAPTVPAGRGLRALRAHTAVWANPDPQHRDEFPVEYLAHES